MYLVKKDKNFKAPQEVLFFSIHTVSVLVFYIFFLTLFFFQNAVRFIMFSVITNIYNKKTKSPTLKELFTATGKLIIAAPNMTRVWQDLEYRFELSCYPWCTHRTSLVIKKLFSFPVGVNNSIKVGALIFLL
jgi:hypothetical protein